MIRRTFSGIFAFLQTPIGVILITNAVWQGIVWAAKIPSNIIVSVVILVIDGIVAYYLFDRLIYFFSQFVLPIQNPKYRQEIYSRVLHFETGRRGPAFFIKNGRVIKHKGEEDKRGAGVIVLDTASAAVLRTDTEVRDTIGPGVKFTKWDEYIAGSVDLRSQWLFIGPQPNDQPYLNPVPTSPKDFSEVQNRRKQTSGHTRDGFEVSPTISIKFNIKRSKEKLPTEGGVTSQYGYDATSVRNAITREVIELGTQENKLTRLDWNKLPAHLVVNIWREYVRKFKLADLFTDDDNNGLQFIEKMINQRVRQYSVEILDDTGSKTGGWQPSLEFQQLKSRGLEITEVRIHNVFFDKDATDIEKQAIEQWSAEWLNNAQKEEKFIKVKESLMETQSREEASKKFAEIASRQFSGKTTMPQDNPFKTLQLLILPLKEFILSESSASNDMEKELRKLDDIWKWLLDNTVEIVPPENAADAPPSAQSGNAQ
ncbi:MAG: hypothetical protein HY864_07095 [Chloroflexi bacterium]|nr:hypothetical protein [Chloroflexota bacterium]